MSEWIWIGVNGLLGLPLAAWVVVVLRESTRAVLAPLLGFRVFALQWGAGRRRFERPIGPIDLVLSPWPIAGATVARSGAPRRHRLGRILLAVAPAVLQTGWLVARLVTGIRPGASPLFEGPAPLACLDLANALLLVAHATLALEFRGGVRSDVRLLLDAILGRTDSDRAARANHYARLAVHHLDRAQVDSARAALAQGLRQLGPQTLLVACQQQVERSDLESVVDQGECADVLRREIEASEPRRRSERAAWSWRERLRQGTASAIPMLAALLALTFAQADAWARHLEAGMLRVGLAAVEAGDAEACTRMLDAWQDWAERVDPWLPPPHSVRSERHRSLSRLEGCRGAFDHATAHHGEALLAAQAATTTAAPDRLRDPAVWLADELRVTGLLRETARIASEQSRHRDALRTLRQAEQRLGQAEQRLPLFPSREALQDARSQVAREREALGTERLAVLDRMQTRR